MSRTALAPFLVVVALVGPACGLLDDASTTRASERSEPRDAAGSAAPGGGSASTISWGTCEEELALLVGLECGFLEVPVDHTDPTGDATIELAVARSTSTGGDAERIGSLVLNPGGPGGSGIEFLASAATRFPTELTERFDLVSFDPRGVASSAPVRCQDDEEKDTELEGDLSPDSPEGIQRAVDEQVQFLESCLARADELIRHMSTADVATDLDLLRAALGDEELSYVGFSYGTSVGATYATLFPDRTRALVLDGSISPTATTEESVLAQARGFERTLANFVTACDGDDACALAPDAAAAIDAARSGLEGRPVEVRDASGTRTMGPDLFDLALATALYDTSLWGTAAEAVSELRSGGAELLFRLVDRQTGRQPDGTYDNSTDSRAMVNCADATDRLSEQEAIDAARRIADAAPRFGPLLGWSTLGCVDWPEPVNPLPAPTGEGAPPILVIGTLGDPATPYEWSEEMAVSLASGVLLTYEGDGHTAFLRAGDCVDDIVVDYLVDLTVPSRTSCPPSEDSVGFSSLADLAVEEFVEGGLPEELARCVVDGIRDEVGDDRFSDLLMGSDLEELRRLVTAQALRCSTTGG